MGLRVQAVWTGPGGTPYLSTFNFQGDTQLEADNAVTAVGNFLGTVDNSIDTGISWATNAEVLRWSDSTLEPTGIRNTTPATGSGSSAGVGAPYASQGLVRWRTGVFIGGREVRGRLFLPHLVHTGDGVVSAATVSAVNTACATLIADPNSVLIVASRRHLTGAPVVSGSLWNQYATLRSRRPSFG